MKKVYVSDHKSMYPAIMEAETVIIEPGTYPERRKYERPEIKPLKGTAAMALCSPGASVAPEGDAVCAAGNSPVSE